ncbi:hypothetical protein EMIHUDRAFT_352559, partial [Emiliania huxleyi CCMP1516]
VRAALRGDGERGVRDEGRSDLQYAGPPAAAAPPPPAAEGEASTSSAATAPPAAASAAPPAAEPAAAEAAAAEGAAEGAAAGAEAGGAGGGAVRADEPLLRPEELALLLCDAALQRKLAEVASQPEAVLAFREDAVLLGVLLSLAEQGSPAGGGGGGGAAGGTPQQVEVAD